MRVSLAPAARGDLSAIDRYIAAESPRSGAKTVKRPVEACDALADFPSKGRKGRVPGTRELVTVPSYIIVYRVHLDRVQVLRIRHAAQDR